MAEARGMGEEDKPRPDARTKAQREKIKQEGAEESPLRTKGREILKEREERDQSALYIYMKYGYMSL